VAFGGNVRVAGNVIRVQPVDSFRQRVYLASYGPWLTLEAGTFEGVEVNPRTNVIRIGLSPRTADTPQARLDVEQPAKITGVGTYHPRSSLKKERDASVISIKPVTSWIELTDR